MGVVDVLCVPAIAFVGGGAITPLSAARVILMSPKRKRGATAVRRQKQSPACSVAGVRSCPGAAMSAGLLVAARMARWLRSG